MAPEERPISPEQIPEEVRRYMAAVQPESDHPMVKGHFHQVTWLSLLIGGQTPVDFYVLEFRKGADAALIWADGQGNWGTGPWVRLSHADADITCPPSPVSMAYFEGVPVQPTLRGALDLLAARMPSGDVPSEEKRPWWRFWK